MFMSEASTHSPRWLRWLAGAARWALGALLAFWVLLALAWAGLHWWIVPRIDDWRPVLEQQARRALGVDLRVARLSARRSCVLPPLELSGVQVLDAWGQAALHLQRVVLALSPRSLLRLGFRQIYIDAPVLQVRRDPQGQWFVAGLPVAGAGGDASAIDWLLSQREVVIQGGAVQWVDALRGLPPVGLSAVDLVLRGGAWDHAIRLDATPPPEWGARFSLRARLHEPLLSPFNNAWTRWSGEAYAEWPEVDMARLAPYLDLQGVRVDSGRGALRSWLDVQQGQLRRAVSDVALAQVRVQWPQAQQPLALAEAGARLGFEPLAAGFAAKAERLHFRTDDGLAWRSDALALRMQGEGSARRSRLQADQLDLALLARIASRVPLAPALRDALATYAPEGRVEQLQAGWQGPLDAIAAYSAKGRVAALSLAGGDGKTCAPAAFGLRNAAGHFELTQAGGSAALSIEDGALLLPGVFEDPCLPLQTLAASVLSRINGDGVSVESSDLRFANADAQGQARLRWSTGGTPASRLPGMLDLSGSLTRANGTRVHRYLPLAVGTEARHYVRDAITAGVSDEVKFRVRGDLRNLPFEHDPQGEFHIAARVKNTTYAYAPRSVLKPGDRPWPALTGLSGALVFDRASMRVEGAAGQVAGSPRLAVSQVSARIPDLATPVVQVTGDVAGPLADMLAFARGSQVSQLTQGALDGMQAQGAASLRLQLQLPIAGLEQSRVQGSVQLAGNEVRVAPAAPLLTQAHGQVQFSERGFDLQQVRAQALGGEVRLSGGLKAPAQGGDAVLAVQASGVASDEGLRAATADSPGLRPLAAHLHGQAQYELALGVRQGVPEILVTTDLQGMALDLPAPLGKPREQALPVRFQSQLVAAAHGSDPPLERLTLKAGERLAFNYLQSLGHGGPQVLSGRLVLGPGDAAAQAGERGGVQASVTLDALDLDAWSALTLAPAPGRTARRSPWEPDRVDLRVASLTYLRRTLHDVVAHAFAEGGGWRASVAAREMEGSIAYRPADADLPQGQVQARLSRLLLPKAAESQVDSLLDDGPGELPALDVQVQDFELRGKHLGQLTLQAHNRTSSDGLREWRLTHLDLAMPEANFSSSGNWALLGRAGPDAQRRTALKFELKVRDSGALLDRLGMPGVLGRGSGQLSGQVGWRGSPMSPDYPSMTGQVRLDMASGQFLKADPGLSKLLGVLSLQALPRRLALDFRDVFSAGFSFDFVRGDVKIANGIASTNNLQMKGVNAAVLMEGQADIAGETQDLHVVVVPELNTLTASLVATAINPLVGLGSFLAQFVLGDTLVKAATREFRIDGTWSDPQVRQVPAGEPGAKEEKKP